MKSSSKVIVAGCLALSCALAVTINSAKTTQKQGSVTSAVKAAGKTKSVPFMMPECFYWDTNYVEVDLKGVRTPKFPTATAASIKVRDEIKKTKRPIFLIWSRNKAADFPALSDPRVQQLLAKEYYVVRVAGIGGHYYVTDNEIQTRFWDTRMYCVGNSRFGFYREWSASMDGDTLLAELTEANDHLKGRGFYADTSKLPSPDITPFIEDAVAIAKKKNHAIVISLYAYRCPPSNTFDRNVINSARVLTYMANTAVLCRLDADNEGSTVMDRAGLYDFPAVLVLSPQGRITSMYDGNDNGTEFVKYLKKAVPAAIKATKGIDVSDIPCKWMPGWGHDYDKAVLNARKNNRKILVYIDDHGWWSYRVKYGDRGLATADTKNKLQGYELLQVEPANNPLATPYKLGVSPFASVIDPDKNICLYDGFTEFSHMQYLPEASKLDTTREDAEVLRRIQLNPVTLEPIEPRDPKIDKENSDDPNWLPETRLEILTRHYVYRFKPELAYRALLEYVKWSDIRKTERYFAPEFGSQICRQFTNLGQHDRAIAAGELAVKLIAPGRDAEYRLEPYYFLGKAYVMSGQHLDKARKLLELTSKITDDHAGYNTRRLADSAAALLAEIDKIEGKKAGAPAK